MTILEVTSDGFIVGTELNLNSQEGMKSLMFGFRP